LFIDGLPETTHRSDFYPRALDYRFIRSPPAVVCGLDPDLAAEAFCLFPIVRSHLDRRGPVSGIGFYYGRLVVAAAVVFHRDLVVSLVVSFIYRWSDNCGTVPSFTTFQQTNARYESHLNLGRDTIGWNCKHAQLVEYHFSGFNPAMIFKDPVNNLPLRPSEFARFIDVTLG
jgi:hypothetical protein